MEQLGEPDLGEAMRDLYRQWKDECRYNANRFMQLLDRAGPLKTAIQLVGSSQPSKGFLTLHAYKKLDLTVEALILRPEFSHLFPAQVVEMARRRLDEFSN